MSEKQQTLDQWVAEEMSRLARFRRNWINNNKKDRENWPMRQLPGDWDDQYLMYAEDKDDPL